MCDGDGGQYSAQKIGSIHHDHDAILSIVFDHVGATFLCCHCRFNV
jgi:hypothetical protein